MDSTKDIDLFLQLFRYIKVIFKGESTNIIQWFSSNKLCLNAKKKHFLSHKPGKTGGIPLKLPKLTVNNHITNRETRIYSISESTAS